MVIADQTGYDLRTRLDWIEGISVLQDTYYYILLNAEECYCSMIQENISNGNYYTKLY